MKAKSKEELIEQLRVNREKLKELTNELSNSIVYSDEEANKPDNSGLIVQIKSGKTVLNKLLKKIPWKEKNEPSIPEAENLLLKKKNKEAVDMLIVVTNRGEILAGLRLGKVFLYGVTNKLGKTEFKDIGKATKCFKFCFKKNLLEGGYYLGLAYKMAGESILARKIFIEAHERGNIKATSELVVLLQEDAFKENDPLKKIKIKQKIENIRADLSFSV